MTTPMEKLINPCKKEKETNKEKSTPMENYINPNKKEEEDNEN